MSFCPYFFIPLDKYCLHTNNSIYNALSNNFVMFWQHKLKKKIITPEHSKPTSGMVFFFKNRVSSKSLVILDKTAGFAYF